jgi:hypothetical protein
MFSPCFAITILLPFCGKVTSTEPFGISAAFFFRASSLSSARAARTSERSGPPEHCTQTNPSMAAFFPLLTHDGAPNQHHVHHHRPSQIAW